jgi:microcystin degradation protein MlrC
VWIGDPAEAQYLQTTPAHLIEVAARLVAAQGLLRIEGEWAEATPGLMNQAERFENARKAAVEELEKKHAFERG